MNGEGHVERDEVSKVSGLQFVAKEDKDGDGDVEMNTNETAVLRSSAEEQKPKTADEEALEALVADGTRKSTLVVPAVPQAADADEDWRSRRAGAVDEDDHFRSDVASRPDSAGLDDYARVPVEEFGLGMLRGMGWKEGEVVGKNKNQISKPRSVERRPALLGIGAKEVPGGVGEELGAWGKATKGRKGKVDKMYNPVVLRNSRTGEMFTEEELQAKKERQQEEESEWRERREKNLKVDEDRKSERMRRERSMSRESKYHSSRQESPRSRDRSHGSSRREGSSSKERRHQGKKRDYDVDDRREKERRRRNRDDRDDSMSSRHSHRSREEYDDTRRRRNEVY